MNEHDSEIMAGLLIENGYVQASSRDEADIVIFNTCSIRENADKRFFGTLGQLKHRKEQEKENFTVCVCGCMMQQQHITDTLKAKYPWVDVVCGTHNFHELPKLLENLYTEQKKQFDIWPDGGITENLPAERLFRHKSFVNIMYGCNNFCSYCIVPYTRGRERSRRPQDILREVHHLSADGVREITLLGQNVNSYKGEEADFVAGIAGAAVVVCVLRGIEGMAARQYAASNVVLGVAHGEKMRGVQTYEQLEIDFLAVHLVRHPRKLLLEFAPGRFVRHAQGHAQRLQHAARLLARRVGARGQGFDALSAVRVVPSFHHIGKPERRTIKRHAALQIHVLSSRS